MIKKLKNNDKCALILNRTYPTLKVRTLDYQIWQMMSSKLTKK